MVTISDNTNQNNFKKAFNEFGLDNRKGEMGKFLLRRLGGVSVKFEITVSMQMDTLGGLLSSFEVWREA